MHHAEVGQIFNVRSSAAHTLSTPEKAGTLIGAEKVSTAPPFGVSSIAVDRAPIVKVTTGYFILGLSAAPANIQLLKERAWFDNPIVYTNNRRAVLRMEKAEAGAQRSISHCE
jgi:hypothetical protein